MMTRLSRSLALAVAAAVVWPVHAQPGHGHGAHASPPQGQHASAHPPLPDPASVAAPEGVTVTGCWIRGMPARLPSAGYFQLHNAGPQDAVLVGAQAEGFGKVMLHAHQSAGGMSAMVHVETVIVPAGGNFAFAPGGHHVMLEQPSADVLVGSWRPIALWFEGGRALTTECEVRPPATMK